MRHFSIFVLLFFTTFVMAACAPQGEMTALEQAAENQAEGTLPEFDHPAPSERVEAFPESARKYDRAWTREDAMIVIDAYEGNSIDWDKMATDERVAGVIHRATIGLRVDSKYKSRQAIAEQRGYLWGAYHLGRPGDPINQAQMFLQTIGDPSHVLMILDLEDTSSGNFMNVSDAKIFMRYIYEQTGKIPVVYANHSVTKSLSTAVKDDPLFSRSRLWYARFRSNIPNFPASLWPTYFLWQFSSELNCSSSKSCLYRVPGTKTDMDVNVFYGNRAALAYQWDL